MKHYLRTNYLGFLNLKDKRIKNKEILNLIEERDEIEIGTQVVINISASSDYILEVVKIEEENIWWEVKTRR